MTTTDTNIETGDADDDAAADDDDKMFIWVQAPVPNGEHPRRHEQKIGKPPSRTLELLEQIPKRRFSKAQNEKSPEKQNQENYLGRIIATPKRYGSGFDQRPALKVSP